ncbi:MAG TPA: glutamine-hydrolyzing GMP synthase [Firmicutes bacterium]|jgi:GMP synthase (glutamine-hydrolysing)|nr:glutamine-hydrolyzing GMP synthase [Candidatus Fermentithermobacillaceae bacterium]
MITMAQGDREWYTQFVCDSVARIREITGSARAIVGISGGVDSTVAAVLVHRAIGGKLIPVMIDNGLLREGEIDFVVSSFEGLGIDLRVVDASSRFLARLAGVRDPEAKRKIIGEEFIRVFEEEAAKYQDVRFLVQGTIRSDVVESGTSVEDVEEDAKQDTGDQRPAQLVKSHHNVGGLPEQMDLELLEPLRDLYKEQVRLVGEELGLPKPLIYRHPFPGPGLAVRVLGEVTQEKLDILRKAQAVLDREIIKSGWYDRLWQYFCVLPDVRTVGVKEGGRTCGHLVAIRAVLSSDAMIAKWAPIPHDLLDRIALKITEEVPQVNRVVYDITSKPPGTIEWE